MLKTNQIIPTLIQKLGIEKEWKQSEFIEKTLLFLGPLAKHIEIEKIERGFLYLQTKSAPAMHQIHLHKKTLLEQLNTQLSDKIKEIQIRFKSSS